MMMSSEEVKKFWQDYCQRRGIAKDLVAMGNARIEADPEHWADHTMQELLEALTGKH